MDETIKKIDKLLYTLDQRADDDVVEVFFLFKEVVDNFRKEIEKQLSKLEGETGEAFSDVGSALDKLEKKVQKEIEKTESGSLSKLKDLAQKLEREVGKIREEMPSMPDLSLLEGKIGEVEKKIVSITAEEIRNKLESLKGEERLDKSAIKGLEEELKALEKKIEQSGGRRSIFGGSRSNNSTKFHDLSSQTNGTLKVFTVPKSVASIVLCSDFPTVLMEGNGFTLNGTRTQITLTVENAPSAGSKLLYQYSSMFN